MGRYNSLLRGCLASLLGATFLISCSGDKWDSRLSKKELQACLEELYTMEQAIKATPLIGNDTLHLALQQSLFQKYGLTIAEFDSVIFYYNKNNPLLYADIARKAAENTRKRLKTLNKQNKFIAQNRAELFFQELSLLQISSLIPPKTYPKLVRCGTDYSLLLHNALVGTKIPKETRLSLKASIMGLPNTIFSKQPEYVPHLTIGYYVSDSLQAKSSCPLAENKEYNLLLEFDKEYPEGLLTIGIEQKSNAPYLHNILIQSMELSSLNTFSEISGDSILLQAIR